MATHRDRGICGNNVKSGNIPMVLYTSSNLPACPSAFLEYQRRVAV